MRFAALVFTLAACARADGETPKGPVVLELFTSQGCSSCPPADRLLAKLAEKADLAPLSFHVDYWDDLGWADPYAKPAWSERQRLYARALGDDRVYTPELVVGGAKGVVGSNAVAVQSALASIARPALLAATGAWSDATLEVTATAPPDADVFVAVWEGTRANKVPRGENSGETLAHTRVVRRLERVARAGTRGTIAIDLSKDWRSVGAVAFAQRTDRKIVASAFLRR